MTMGTVGAPIGPISPLDAAGGHGMSNDRCAEFATRRAGGQPAGRIWHTLVSCSLTTEYRPVRPLGEAVASHLVTLSNSSLTVGNIFQFVMT
jgi:hypothetical protein